MNEAAQRALVHPEAGRLVKPAQSCPASSADAVLVERKCVEERRVTAGAEILGFKRSGRVQALIANGNPRPLAERTPANAAIRRKKPRKNAVGDLVNHLLEEVGSRRSRYLTTREGAPPDIVPVSRRCWSEIS